MPTFWLPTEEFQSALPRGERQDHRSRQTGTDQFQSALPRGERHYLFADFYNTQNFNPRSREGSDTLGGYIVPLGRISIRAPARGATHTVKGQQEIERFQSALPRGERPKGVDIDVEAIEFQSALPRGERHQFSPKSSLLS